MKTKELKNFTVNAKWLNQGLLVLVPEQGFYYNHDEAFKAGIINAGKSAAHSLTRPEGYSKTSGYPKWAKDYVGTI